MERLPLLEPNERIDLPQLLRRVMRTTLGFMYEGGGVFECIHSLLGRFLADRDSESPLPDRNLFSEGGFDWGRAPLDRVITSPDDLERLLVNPAVYRNSIAIIEPWDHVGFNERGEKVRASRNVAYVLQKIANADTVLFPLWSGHEMDVDVLAHAMSAGLAVVVEGGEPSVYEPSTFEAVSTSFYDDIMGLTERLLLLRSPTSAPCIFICLGHQLAAEAHIRLLKRAVKQVLQLSDPGVSGGERALDAVRRAADRIHTVAESIVVHTHGQASASGWDAQHFAVGRNEVREVGVTRLQSYCPSPSAMSTLPFEITHAHELAADELHGIIDTMLAYERDIHIAMFHADEVNEEAMLFANWAYRLLHNAVAPHRHAIACSPLSWLLRLPYGIEILCSTAAEGDVLTEVSATCINYRDFETHRIRRSFTTQFHPELLADLRAFGSRGEASYAELKKDDGIRLLARLLYEAMQE